jgi:hypothetical protein
MAELPAGRRRIDLVLSQRFIEGLPGLSFAEVRRRRMLAQQEEADLSYIRRMLQGRIDLLNAEAAGRSSGKSPEVLANLVAILSEDGQPRTTRYREIAPSASSASRREEEQILNDPRISNPASMSDGQLAAVLQQLRQQEQNVSKLRHLAQEAVDVLTAEIVTRYRQGSANAEDLLTERDYPGMAS